MGKNTHFPPFCCIFTMGDFAGILSPDRADALLKHVEQSRSEWDRVF